MVAANCKLLWALAVTKLATTSGGNGCLSPPLYKRSFSNSLNSWRVLLPTASAKNSALALVNFTPIAWAASRACLTSCSVFQGGMGENSRNSACFCSNLVDFNRPSGFDRAVISNTVESGMVGKVRSSSASKSAEQCWHKVVSTNQTNRCSAPKGAVNA